MPAFATVFGLGEQDLAPYFIFPGVCAMAIGYLVYFVLGRDGVTRNLERAEAAVCALIMNSLRRKLNEKPSNARYIKTEVGVGYRFIGE